LGAALVTKKRSLDRANEKLQNQRIKVCRGWLECNNTFFGIETVFKPPFCDLVMKPNDDPVLAALRKQYQAQENPPTLVTRAGGGIRARMAALIAKAGGNGSSNVVSPRRRDFSNVRASRSSQSEIVAAASQNEPSPRRRTPVSVIVYL